MLLGTTMDTKSHRAANTIATTILELVHPSTHHAATRGPACGDGGNGSEADDPRDRTTQPRPHRARLQTAAVHVSNMSCDEATEHMVVGTACVAVPSGSACRRHACVHTLMHACVHPWEGGRQRCCYLILHIPWCHGGEQLQPAP